MATLTVTVTEALVLRPLLEDRGCITESWRHICKINNNLVSICDTHKVTMLKQRSNVNRMTKIECNIYITH